jgi:hypothetical protein
VVKGDNPRSSAGELEPTEQGIDEAESAGHGRELALVPAQTSQVEFELDWARRNQMMVKELASMLRSNAGVGFGGKDVPWVLNTERPVPNLGGGTGEAHCVEESAGARPYTEC